MIARVSRRLVALLLCGLALLPVRGESQLRGLMLVGDQWFASLVDAEAGGQAWLAVGERFASDVIERVTSDSVTLLDAAGTRRTLVLRHAQVTSRNAPPVERSERRRWVNSRDNPMLHQPAALPSEFTRWLELGEGRRTEIVEWYAAHGWKLTVSLDATGRSETEFAPLHGDERQVILAAKRSAFMRALSSEQRTLFVAAHEKGSQDQPEKHAAFCASLSPGGREAFAQLGDFTTPLPAKLQ